MKQLILCIVLMLTVCNAGAVMITPVSVDASSTYFTYDVDDLINDSGINGSLHSTNYRHMWMNDEEGASGILTFDLGGIFSVTSTDIWQYNFSGERDRGVQAFEILGSTDGLTFSLITNASLLKSLGGSISAQSVTFNATAQYIRFNITSNHGDPTYAGLSEVKFKGDISSVPAPATTCLLGLGLVGLVRATKYQRGAE